MGLERAVLEGRFGTVEYEYQMYRSDLTGREIEELPGVSGASFTMSNFRDHSWELTLPMLAAEALDIFSDYVKLVVTTRSGPHEYRRPFGLYFFEKPEGEDSPMAAEWNLSGKSPEALLMGSTAEKGYRVNAGVGVLSAVRTLLIDRGIPENRINFPPVGEDKALTTIFYADPFTNAEGTRYLRICNALLAAGGFYALWTDNDGRFTTKKIRDASKVQTDITYGTTEDADRIIASEKLPYEYDDENFANRIVVQSSDPQLFIVAVAENHDPNSRVSYEAIERWVQPDPILVENIADAAEALKIARAQLRIASGMNLTREFETSFDFRMKPRQVYGLEVFDDYGEPIVTGIEWPVVNVEAALDLSPMSHQVHYGVRL